MNALPTSSRRPHVKWNTDKRARTKRPYRRGRLLPNAERTVRDGCIARDARRLKLGDLRLRNPGWNELPDWPRPIPDTRCFGRQPNPQPRPCSSRQRDRPAQALWVNSRSLGCWLKALRSCPCRAPGGRNDCSKIWADCGGLERKRSHRDFKCDTCRISRRRALSRGLNEEHLPLGYGTRRALFSTANLCDIRYISTDIA